MLDAGAQRSDSLTPASKTDLSVGSAMCGVVAGLLADIRFCEASQMYLLHHCRPPVQLESNQLPTDTDLFATFHEHTQARREETQRVCGVQHGCQVVLKGSETPCPGA